MEDKASMQQKPLDSPGRMKGRRLLLILCVPIVLILVYCGYNYWQKNSLPNIRSGQAVNIKYHNLAQHSIKGTGEHNGLTFSAPEQFINTDHAKTVSPIQLQLSRQAKLNNKSLTAGYILTQALYINPPPSADTIKTIGKSITSPSQNNVRNVFSPQAFGMPKNLFQGYKVVSSTGTIFTSGNINKDAWVRDFSASATDPNAKLPDMQGHMITVFGKSAIYYLVVYTTKFDWQANQATWSQVINSLKIDQ